MKQTTGKGLQPLKKLIVFIKDAIISFSACLFMLVGIVGIQTSLAADEPDYFGLVVGVMLFGPCLVVVIKKIVLPVCKLLWKAIKHSQENTPNVPAFLAIKYSDTTKENADAVDAAAATNITDVSGTSINFDYMDGPEFERFCAKLLSANNFNSVELTGRSGDQGVDIVAIKDGVRYAVQCKRYSHTLGNTPIQEVNAGKVYYNCHIGAVMTNQYFTKGGKDLALKTGTLLWDRDALLEFLRNMTGDVVEIVPAAKPQADLTAHKETSISASEFYELLEQEGLAGPFDGKTFYKTTTSTRNGRK